MVKTLMLIDSLGSGGAQRQFVELAVGLKLRNHSVIVVCYNNYPFFKPKLTDNGISVLELNTKNFIRRLWGILKIIQKEKVTHLVSFLDMPNFLSCLVKILSFGKIKVIVSERSLDAGPRSNFRVLLHFMFFFVDRVVANSSSQSDLLKKRWYLKNKVHYIVNSVDLVRFPMRESSVQQSSQLKIVTVANYSKHKNPDLLVKWSLLNRSSDQRFVFYWYGNLLLKDFTTIHDNYYLKIKEELGESSDLFLCPATSQVSEIYCGADALCLPSFYEGTPNVICEAMSSGLPILCSKVADNPQIVEEGVNGYLFDPNDIDSFREALDKLYRLGHEGRVEMGKRNRLRAEKLFSQKIYLDRWIEQIHSIT